MLDYFQNKIGSYSIIYPMLYLVRHAQASYLSDNYDQLSDLGISQAKSLGTYLSRSTEIHQKFVGPHKRQLQTANQIREAYTHINEYMPSPTLIPQLKEHSGPATLHHHKPLLIKRDPKCIQWHQESIAQPSTLRENSIKIFDHFIPQWMAGKYAVDGLEDFNTFRKEIAEGLSIILKGKQQDENTLIVTSAGSISAIMAHLLKIDDINEIAQISLKVNNASVTTLEPQDKKWKLFRFNQVDHLTDEMKTVV